MKDDYSEWLSQKALKGKLPDVFMVLPEDFSTFSSVGMLKKLDSYVQVDKAFKKVTIIKGVTMQELIRKRNTPCHTKVYQH